MQKAREVGFLRLKLFQNIILYIDVFVWFFAFFNCADLECNQGQQTRKKVYQSDTKIPHRIAYVNGSLLRISRGAGDLEDSDISDSSDFGDPTYEPSEVSDSESENEMYAKESVTEGRKGQPRKRVYQAPGQAEVFQSPKRACFNSRIELEEENVLATAQSQPKERAYQAKSPQSDRLQNKESVTESENCQARKRAYKQGEQSKVKENAAKGSYRKPYRFCIFCQSMKSKLSVHIKEQHGEEERVKIALLLPKSERDAAFQGFKKEGILKQNKEEVKKANPKYSRERSSNHKHAGELVMCSICEGFYSKVYIKRHQDQCMKQSQSSNCDTKPIRLNMFERFTDKEDTRFVMNVLGKFRDDAVGKMCTTDPVLMEIGKKLWSKEKRKVDRKAEVRRGVMRDMRRIGTFYQEMLNSEEKLGPLKVKKGDVSDIFHCRNFKHLEEAVETMTLKEDQSGIKAGLKHCLYYLLKTASRIVKVLYILDNDDEAANGVDKFVSLFEMNHNFIFGDASYQINNARESKLRRPAERPLENDMSILRDYILNRTEELLRDEYEFMNLHQYIELRNLTLCRLTLFNARRGGEPAQLVTKHWEDAESGAWLDQQNMGQLNPLDAAIASTLKIAFQTGKRNALVPILFPKDTVEPLKVLSSEEVRSSVGISSENKFLFPSTTSDDHVSGWHVLDSICRKLNLGKMVNATKNRHRISTAFALLDVPQEDRPYTYLSPFGTFRTDQPRRVPRSSCCQGTHSSG